MARICPQQLLVLLSLLSSSCSFLMRSAHLQNRQTSFRTSLLKAREAERNVLSILNVQSSERKKELTQRTKDKLTKCEDDCKVLSRPNRISNRPNTLLPSDSWDRQFLVDFDRLGSGLEKPPKRHFQSGEDFDNHDYFNRLAYARDFDRNLERIGPILDDVAIPKHWISSNDAFRYPKTMPSDNFSKSPSGSEPKADVVEPVSWHRRFSAAVTWQRQSRGKDRDDGSGLTDLDQNRTAFGVDSFQDWPESLVQRLSKVYQSGTDNVPKYGEADKEIVKTVHFLDDIAGSGSGQADDRSNDPVQVGDLRKMIVSKPNSVSDLIKTGKRHYQRNYFSEGISYENLPIPQTEHPHWRVHIVHPITATPPYQDARRLTFQSDPTDKNSPSSADGDLQWMPTNPSIRNKNEAFIYGPDPQWKSLYPEAPDRGAAFEQNLEGSLSEPEEPRHGPQGSSSSISKRFRVPLHKKVFVYGQDDRLKVFLPQMRKFPFSNIVRLSSGCTGTLVTPRHVLTAAHCVHNGLEFRNNLEKLKIEIPDTMGFKDYYAQMITVPSGWLRENRSKVWGKQSGKRAVYDYAVVQLKLAVAGRTKFLPLAVPRPEVLQMDFHFLAFPEDDQQLWRSVCGASQHMALGDGNLIMTRCDAAVGNSGAAVFIKDPHGGMRVVGILSNTMHVNHHRSFLRYSIITALTWPKLNDICAGLGRLGRQYNVCPPVRYMRRSPLPPKAKAIPFFGRRKRDSASQRKVVL